MTLSPVELSRRPGTAAAPSHYSILSVVLLGLIMQTVPMVPSVVMFGAVMLALIVVTAVILIRTNGRGASDVITG